MKKFRNLSLVLAGFALGVTVAYSPQIHAAATSLLGSKVGKVLDVKINTKSIGSGAVINGTTYVPLRAAANAMGMEVTKVDSKEVTIASDDQDLSAKAKEEQAQLDKQAEEANAKNNKIFELTRDIQDLKLKLQSYDTQTAKLQKEIDDNKSMFTGDPNGDKLFQSIEDSKKRELQEIADHKAVDAQKLADLESQLAELQK